MAEKRGRYTLKIEKPFSHKIIEIPFVYASLLGNVEEDIVKEANQQFKGKTKLPLTLIDLMSTNYDNDEDLLGDLSQMDSNFGYGRLKISYKNNGHDNNVKIIYAENNWIRNFAVKYFKRSQINISDSVYKRFIERVCDLCKNKAYLTSYLCDDWYLSRAMDAVSIYNNCDPYEQISFNHVLEQLNNYKMVRHLYLGILDYLNNEDEIKDSYRERKERLKYLKDQLLEQEEPEIVKNEKLETLPLFSFNEDDDSYTYPDFDDLGYPKQKK